MFFSSNLIIFIGIALVCWGIKDLIDQKIFINNSTTTKGKVIDLIEDISADNLKWYFPVVQFLTPSGQTIKFTSKIAAKMGQITKIGDELPVNFLINNPEKAEINQFVYSYGFSTMIIFIGIFAVFIGLFAIPFMVSINSSINTF